MCVRMHAYVHACLCACMPLCARAYMGMCACARARVYVCVCRKAFEAQVNLTWFFFWEMQKITIAELVNC